MNPIIEFILLLFFFKIFDHPPIENFVLSAIITFMVNLAKVVIYYK